MIKNKVGLMPADAEKVPMGLDGEADGEMSGPESFETDCADEVIDVIDGAISKYRELVCIVCPRGCKLSVMKVDSNLEVSGNFCPRGRDFALGECTNPQRTISSTVATVFKDAPVVPVRVSGEIPKDMIFKVMDEIRKVRLDERLGRGKPVIKNVLGLNMDVIITSGILTEN